MRRRLIVIASICATALLVAWLTRGDETKIRAVLASLETNFNDPHASNFVAGFSADYHDESFGADKSDLLAALRYVFETRRNKEGDHCIYRIEVPSEDAEIELSTDAESAVVRFRPELYDRGKSDSEDDDELVWSASITAALHKRDGVWLITNSECLTEKGRLPH